MLRLVDYESTGDDDSEVLSSGDEKEEMNLKPDETQIFENDVKSTLNAILNQICKTAESSVRSKENVPNEYIFDRKGYRDMVSHRHDSSSSSSSEFCLDDSSDNDYDGVSSKCPTDKESDDSDCIFSNIVTASRLLKKRIVRPPRMPKTKGEYTLQDLPPIENLSISAPQTAQLLRLGVVSSVVDCLVVVLSDFNSPALDQDTVIFTEDRTSLGKIFEIFGPVVRPFYSIRFNNAEEAKIANVKAGIVVYYVPNDTDFTRTVFTDSLRSLKGTDASWEDNNEPPPDIVEFSDDEEERRWRARRRGKTQLNGEQSLENVSDDLMIIENAPAPKRRMKVRRRGAQQRGSCNSHHSGQDLYPNYSNAESTMPATAQYPPIRPMQSQYRQRNPWFAAGRPMFPVPPPPMQPPPNGTSWMWMSEDTFRLPPPPLPQNFGRRMMFRPPQFPLPPPPHITDHRFVQRNA